jgi:hypothetical protein
MGKEIISQNAMREKKCSVDIIKYLTKLSVYKTNLSTCISSFILIYIYIPLKFFFACTLNMNKKLDTPQSKINA